MIFALVGLVAGQAVVWYTGQFYALFFLQSIRRIDLFTANVLIARSLILGTGGFIVFGILSDKIGRKPVILAGCLIGALTYFPLFSTLTSSASPKLAGAIETVQVRADPATCGLVFDPVGIRQFTTPCNLARVALARAAIRYELVPAPAGTPTTVTFNGTEVPIETSLARNIAAFTAASVTAGYPAAGDPSIAKTESVIPGTRQAWTVIAILTVLVLYVTMVYGPIAAALVEFFPTRIRYTAMSLPYHIGNGWLAGSCRRPPSR